MTIYVLNSPVLTAYGEYEFTGPISTGEAKTLLEHGFVSAVGHVATAQFLSHLLEVQIPEKRVSVEMKPGDCALVLRLAVRLPEGALMSLEEIRAVPFELGCLLRRS